MWKIIPLSILQSILLTACQVFLKFALAKLPPFGWTKAFWGSLLVNWQLAASGVCFALGSLLWIYILKNFPFSLAYPMISLSYVFGMLAAMIFFHETVSATKWMGVAFIIAGCCLIAK